MRSISFPFIKQSQNKQYPVSVHVASVFILNYSFFFKYSSLCFTCKLLTSEIWNQLSLSALNSLKMMDFHFCPETILDVPKTTPFLRATWLSHQQWWTSAAVHSELLTTSEEKATNQRSPARYSLPFISVETHKQKPKACGAAVGFLFRMRMMK